MASSLEAGPLHWAARSGDIVVVKKIVENNARSVFETDSMGRTPLDHAAWGGHYDIAEYLIEHHSELEHRGYDGWTPMFYAVLSHHPDITRLLVTHGANINALDDIGRTPIFFLGNKDVMDSARVLGAKLDVANNDGITALAHQTEFGGREIVEYLLDHGANPNGLHHGNRCVLPITRALDKRDTVMLVMLIKAGADINAIDFINYYRHYDDSSFTNFLIRHQARMLRNNPSGWSLLHYFAQYSNSNYYGDFQKPSKTLIQMLLNNPNDVNARNSRGQTPLHLAVMSGNFDLVQGLVKHGANINAKDTNKLTPLFYSGGEDIFEYPEGTMFCGNGLKEAAEQRQRVFNERISATILLLNSGADISVLDKRYHLPFYMYLGCFSDSLLRLILIRNPHPYELNRHGEDLLYQACLFNKDINTIKDLLRAGFDINKKNYEGATPLFAAVWNKNPEFVKFLLGNGADKNIRDRYGSLAIDINRRYQSNAEIDDLLK